MHSGSKLYHEDGHETYMLGGRRVSAAEATELQDRGVRFEDVTDYARLKPLAPDLDGYVPQPYSMLRERGVLKYYLRGARVHPGHVDPAAMDDVDQYYLHEGRYVHIGKVCVPERYRAPRVAPQPRPTRVLEQLGIRCRAEWLAWMRQNHPDKNPAADPELVARVNAARSFVSA